VVAQVFEETHLHWLLLHTFVQYSQCGGPTVYSLSKGNQLGELTKAFTGGSNCKQFIHPIRVDCHLMYNPTVDNISMSHNDHCMTAPL